MRPTALYRLYDASDTLVYLGIAYDPDNRWYQHSRERKWWPQVTRKTVTWYDTRELAEAAETAAIRAERPVHNRAGIEREEPAARMADDGVQDVPATIARPLLSKLIRQAREDGVVSALTVHGRRRAYLITPAQYAAALSLLPEDQRPDRPSR